MNLWRAYYNTRDFVRYDFWRGIRNLFKWFKIVWLDRDWDSYFILKTLHFKIRNTRILIEENKTFVGCEEEVKDMKRCEELLERLIVDDYAEEAGWDWERNKMEWDYDKKCPKVNLNPQSKEELRVIFDKAHLQRELERKELFETLNNKVERWWD